MPITASFASAPTVNLPVAGSGAVKTSFLAGSWNPDVLDLTAALDEHAIVAVTDARGRILRVNDKFCTISQYAREELIGQDHRIINSQRHPPEFFSELWRTIARGQVWKGDICNRAKSGSLYWVNTTIVPFLGADGKPIRYVAIRADITERKQAEQRQAELLEAMEQINGELNQFAHVAAHDLKSPLRAISSLADWLAADHADAIGPDGRHKFDLLLGRVRRMDALIEGILQYSCLKRRPEDRVEVDLNELLANACELVAPPATITIRIPRSLPKIHGEPTRLLQVFQNLLANAVKHMGRADGEVTIEYEEQPSGWKFSVRDNGPGIEEIHHERIFQLFQTLQPHDGHENTGIGLAIVKKNIEISGGQIWVESRMGAGSTFHFRLPRAPAAPVRGPLPQP